MKSAQTDCSYKYVTSKVMKFVQTIVPSKQVGCLIKYIVVCSKAARINKVYISSKVMEIKQTFQEDKKLFVVDSSDYQE